MNSDLTDGEASADPGIDQLFRILTTGPTPDELTGEQSALAMFRANVSPLSGPASAHRTTVHGTTVPIPPGRAASAPKRTFRRLLRGPARWGIRLATAAVIAICGMTAAAYAAALPAPVQNLAHHVLGFAGVPEPQHQRHVRTPHAHHLAGPGQSSTSPGVQTHPSQPSKPSAATRASASPNASASPSTAAGSAVLSATASNAVIDAGARPHIDGQLTRAGTGIDGVTVTLIERLAGRPVWHFAGTGQTTSGGNVAITGPPLARNAVFRLRVRHGVHSANVLITVTPQVTVLLNPGASGLRDVLAVTTRYARRGNVVWLQVQSASGSWVKLRSRRLNAAGRTRFILSGTRLKNKTVQVVLVATARHGSAASNTTTVPPPG